MSTITKSTTKTKIANQLAASSEKGNKVSASLTNTRAALDIIAKTMDLKHYLSPDQLSAFNELKEKA